MKLTTDPPKISNLVNEEIRYIALGEELWLTCDSISDGNHDPRLFWQNGQSNVPQFIGDCNTFDINNSSCILPYREYEEYRKLRVKSYINILGKCTRMIFWRSSLDISIVNWTDNGSSYSCVSSNKYDSTHVSQIFIVG